MELSDSSSSFPRTFFLLVFGTVFAAMALVVSFNLVAEQLGGESVTDTSVSNGALAGGTTERGIKYGLLQRQHQLDFVLIGNSRVQRWDPALVTAATGARGFNGGVVGATLADFRFMTEWLDARAKHDHAQMPHVVVVMPLESFRMQTSPDETGVPTFRTQPTTTDKARSRLERIKALTQWQTLKQSISIVKHRYERTSNRSGRHTRIETRPSGSPVDQHAEPAIASTDVRSGGSIDTQFRADGYLEDGAFFGAHVFGKPQALKSFVNGQARNFYEALKLGRGVHQLEPSAQREVIQMLKTANKAGDTPTIVVPPMHPATDKLLSGLGRDIFAQTTLNWLDSLHRTYKFTVLNYLDASQFGSARTAFYDGQHPRPELATKLVERLIRDDKYLTPQRPVGSAA